MKDENQNVTNKEEILSIFYEAIDETFPVMLWQEKGDGKRLFISGYLKEVNEGNVAIGLIDDEERNKFLLKDVPITVNVTGIYANFHFKEKIKFHSSSNIVTLLPEKIRFVAKKTAPKFFYQNSDHNLMMYKILSKKKEKKVFKVHLIKMTHSKVTFFSDETGADRIKLSDELLITKISEHNIPNFQVAKVNYICYFDAFSKFRRRPSRVSARLIPSLEEMKDLPLFVEKEEKRFGMEEIEWMQKEKGTFDDKIETKPETLAYGYEEDGFFYGYTLKEQSAVIHEIGLRDEKLAFILTEQTNYLENLIFLTLHMKEELFRDNNVTSIAMALRLSTKNLISGIMKDLSSNLKSEFLYNLREKKTATAVLKAQKELIRYIRLRENTGSFILSKDGHKDAF